MPRSRNLLDPLRAATVWFLAVFALVLPGLGGSPALASAPTACRASCPCDEAEPERSGDDEAHRGEAEQPEDEAGEEGDDPCQDECPDDCPNCGCGLNLAMAIFEVPVGSSTTSCAVTRSLVPTDAPSKGTRDAVFRPPRFLS